MLADLGSKNGTFLTEFRVSGRRDTAAAAAGDLGIGQHVQLQFTVIGVLSLLVKVVCVEVSPCAVHLTAWNLQKDCSFSLYLTARFDRGRGGPAAVGSAGSIAGRADSWRRDRAWSAAYRGAVTMGVLERIRSLFCARAPLLRPVLPSPNASDDPLLLVLRYSQDLGYLTQRPQRVEPSVLGALSALVDSGREELAIQHGFGCVGRYRRTFSLCSLSPRRCAAPLAMPMRCGLWNKRCGLRQLTISLGFFRCWRRRMSRLAIWNRRGGVLGISLVLDVHHPEARRKLLALRPSASPPHRTGETAMAAAVQRAVLPTVAMVTQSCYELRAELGTGRTGTVYRALDRELGFDVALKSFIRTCDKRLRRRALAGTPRSQAFCRRRGIPALWRFYHVEGMNWLGRGSCRCWRWSCAGADCYRTRLRSGPLCGRRGTGKKHRAVRYACGTACQRGAHGDVSRKTCCFAATAWAGICWQIQSVRWATW